MNFKHFLFLKKLKSKKSKSLSTLITTLLIVLVVIILVGIFISWGRHYIRDKESTSSSLLSDVGKKLNAFHRFSKRSEKTMLVVPIFDPDPKDSPFIGSIDLNIYTTNPSLEIYYTLDGSSPTSNSYLFSEKIHLDKTTTVKAIAYSEEHGASSVVEGLFKFYEGVASNPTFSPVTGSYDSPLSLTLSCSTPNSKIRYTTDNSTPSRTSGFIYSSPLTLTSDTNISAICFSDTTSESDAVTQQYIILQAPILALSSINGRTTIKNNTDSSITFVSYNLAGFDHNAPLDSVLTLAGGATGNIDHGIILENFSLKLVTNTDDLYILENLNQTVLQPLICPTGYIPVPGNYLYDTMNDSNGFCVAKWEMKNVSGNAVSQAALTPWGEIIHPDANTACNNISPGYHLISNNEWMTIVRNIELNPSNWSENEIGNGYIPRGNHTGIAILDGINVGSDESKRTLTLTNGEIIWDLAGNLVEWTDDVITEKDQPDGFKKSGGASGTGWHEYTIFGDLSIYLKWNDLGDTTLRYKHLYLLTSPDYNSTSNGIGNISIISNSTKSTSYVFARGGNWNNTVNAGILYLYLQRNTSFKNVNYGFRCGFSGSTLPKASNPTFSLISGGYPTSTSLSLSCSTPNSTIRYTTDNSTPSRTLGNVYSSPLTLTTDTNISAVCFSDTTSESDVVTQQYTILQSLSVFATGGEVTDIEIDGEWYRVHAFKDLGEDSFNVTHGGNIDVLVIAGGGGGGSKSGNGANGGGGAGGLIFSENYSVDNGLVNIYVGSGGLKGNNGENSIFNNLTAIGGGKGGAYLAWDKGDPGANGGSGGGGSGEFYNNVPGGNGTTNQGNKGGTGNKYANGCYTSGGGGGKGASGSNSSNQKAGNGGVGIYLGDYFSNQFGVNGWFAGGGGGTVYLQAGTTGTQGYGGNGGGGDGARNGNNVSTTTSTPGTDNTGGGGGGGAKGGSGVVLVRYKIPYEGYSI